MVLIIATNSSEPTQNIVAVLGYVRRTARGMGPCRRENPSEVVVCLLSAADLRPDGGCENDLGLQLVPVASTRESVVVA